jgi:methylenetetrahydrofolate dehydrogenase (NADP+)/methenyltetrahydrofolate cyclohydrolase
MVSQLHTLPATTTEAALLSLLASLNLNPHVDGVLVQLPLPGHIRRDRVLDAIAPEKDVDGFHPINVGLLGIGRPNLTPCTPMGCLVLLDSAGVQLRGLRAVVVGCSNIVGKPMAQLLLQREATVTMAHKETRDLPAVCREADVLVVATGCPELIRGGWVKPGVVVLDVGINRVPTPEGTTRIVGDVAFDEVREKARAITPVPGGVGPLTIAHLLLNTLRAAEARVDTRG